MYKREGTLIIRLSLHKFLVKFFNAEQQEEILIENVEFLNNRAILNGNLNFEARLLGCGRYLLTYVSENHIRR